MPNALKRTAYRSRGSSPERDGSRGCINMPVWAVTKLFAWITEGDPVKVIEG